eukprot:295242-Chlamydomonas_euryale.AAC.8
MAFNTAHENSGSGLAECQAFPEGAGGGGAPPSEDSRPTKRGRVRARKHTVGIVSSSDERSPRGRLSLRLTAPAAAYNRSRHGRGALSRRRRGRPNATARCRRNAAAAAATLADAGPVSNSWSSRS